MGSSKKKEKKKKKKRTRDSDYDSPTDRYSDEEYSKKRSSSNIDNGSRSSKNNKAVPQTEEYVYDYSGQEIIRSRDTSLSPRRSSKYESRLRDRSRSPHRRDEGRRDRKKETTPPPLPPGVDWPFDSSAEQPRPPGDDDFNDWRQKDDKKREQDYQDEVDRKYRSKKREENKKAEAEPPAPSTNDNSSLSIEETNKLRIKLGLKPLKLDSADESTTEKSYEDREDVHQPALNLSDKKNQEKMREKMDAVREKRRINQKLRKTKGLAEDEDPTLDSAAAWVAKSRQQEKEKLLATKRAQMLEEMDEEFGISGLIEETVKNIKKEPSYSNKDLKGLKVQHKGSAFKDGTQTVLTLEDKAILDEDDSDVLINVNIAENERTKKNVENRSKKPGYKAYDEVDDETGMLKVRGILDKYDEEIDGVKKASFTIDGTGKVDDAESELERIRETLKSQQVSLEMAAPQLARDYFTEEEMTKFKKPRKKIRKVRKREVLKADDLLKHNQDTSKDRGSRNKNSGKRNNNMEDRVEVDMEIVPAAPDELDYFVALSQHEEPASFVEDDEAEQELQLALERSRRTKQKKGREEDQPDAALEKIAYEVLNKPKVPEPENEQQSSSKSRRKGRSTIVLDSTSEFCRTLGELPTSGIPTSRKKQDEHTTETEDMEVDPEPTKSSGGWEQVEYDKKSENLDNEKEVDEDVLECEPIPTNIAATLNLANMKGYLKDGKEKVRKFDPLNLPETKAEVDVEKLRDEEKGKYSSRGYDRDRDRYDPYAFKDKQNYKPGFKIEYVDNKGRELNQKEAFRLLSHKFHGKGSGKLKTEKRAKKILEEKKLQKMSSIDTPLNTASMFKAKQKQTQSPYLVLSGGGKHLLSG